MRKKFQSGNMVVFYIILAALVVGGFLAGRASLTSLTPGRKDGIAGGIKVPPEIVQSIPHVTVSTINDTFSNAFNLPLGIDTQSVLVTGKDTDYYIFDVPRPSIIQINLGKLPKKYEFYVYDPSKKLIGYSVRMGFSETQSKINAPVAGNYYLKVLTDYQDKTNVPYTIRVSLIPFTE